jgi:hypothetical protein
MKQHRMTKPRDRKRSPHGKRATLNRKRARQAKAAFRDGRFA